MGHNCCNSTNETNNTEQVCEDTQHECCGGNECCNNNGGNFSALDLAEIFWPDTVIYDDRVYLGEPDSEEYQSVLEDFAGDKTTVQALYNHYHLVEIFGEASREDLIDAGLRLQNCWNFCLKSRYPTRNIVVAFDAADEDSIEELQIVVYEE